MSLYIGAFYPDRQLDESLFSQSLVKVAANLAEHRKHSLQVSPPYLDIQFMMPGKQEKPDFTGMRMYEYDSDSSTLRIESAVPERIVNSMHTEEYVLAVMQDAVDNAAAFFESESLGFKTDAYHELINMMIATGSSVDEQTVLN